MKNLIALVVMALFAVPSFTKADVEDRLYDFTDAYYLQNGVNPALISGRMQAWHRDRRQRHSHLSLSKKRARLADPPRLRS